MQPTVISHETMERYPVLSLSMDEVREALTANVGAGGLSQQDLDRITVPAGGGAVWEIPTLEGVQPLPVLEGIVVAWKDVRAYWEHSIQETGGNAPPDCYSDDARTGYGTPGGDCMNCPLSQFGSAILPSGDPGAGQACKAMRLLFMALPGNRIPQIISVPPTSLQAVRKYFIKLSSNGVPCYAAITALSLIPEKNDNGMKYARIVPTMKLRLDAPAAAKMREYASAINPLIQRTRVTQNFN